MTSHSDRIVTIAERIRQLMTNHVGPSNPITKDQICDELIIRHPELKKVNKGEFSRAIKYLRSIGIHIITGENHLLGFFWAETQEQVDEYGRRRLSSIYNEANEVKKFMATALRLPGPQGSFL